MAQEIVKQSVSEDEGTRPGRSYRPNADIGEKADGVWLTVDLPGVDQDSVEVGLDDGVLTIEGCVALGEYDDLRPLYSEYNVGNFERRFRVSNRVDSNGIHARIEHGVLHLFLPKPEEARPRSIAVAAG